MSHGTYAITIGDSLANGCFNVNNRVCCKCVAEFYVEGTI